MNNNIIYIIIIIIVLFYIIYKNKYSYYKSKNKQKNIYPVSSNIFKDSTTNPQPTTNIITPINSTNYSEQTLNFDITTSNPEKQLNIPIKTGIIVNASYHEQSLDKPNIMILKFDINKKYKSITCIKNIYDVYIPIMFSGSLSSSMSTVNFGLKSLDILFQNHLVKSYDINSENARYMFTPDGKLYTINIQPTQTIETVDDLIQNNIDYDIKNARHIIYEGNAPAPCVLTIQNDNNLIIYDANGKPVWTSDTWMYLDKWYNNSGIKYNVGNYLISENGKFKAVFNNDSTISVLNNDIVLIKIGKPIAKLDDIKFIFHENVIKTNNDTNIISTSSVDKQVLFMQNDGQLMIYSINGDKLWTTNTTFRQKFFNYK